MNAKDLLTTRLRALNYEGPLDTADQCRDGILSSLASEAYCARIVTPKGPKHTFRDVFEAAWGVPYETRERAAKRRAV